MIQRSFAFAAEVDPDDLLHALAHIDILEGRNLFFYLQIVVNLVVSCLARVNFEHVLEL